MRPALVSHSGRAESLRRGRPSEPLHIVPVTLRAARACVDAHHRHLPAPIGATFAIGVAGSCGVLRGVAVPGRPASRRLDNGSTIEVRRVATHGCRNACSALFGARARVARTLGYARVFTYTLASETGTSMRAVGWQPKGVSRGGAWSRHARIRRDLQPFGPKQRWEINLGTGRSLDPRTGC